MAALTVNRTHRAMSNAQMKEKPAAWLVPSLHGHETLWHIMRGDGSTVYQKSS